jgi:aspartyl-tRNA(Asn)/glutamyl-tRNA(Gln) amidotransferase subunit B
MDILEDGGRIIQETRLYDADKNETRAMRSKEVANDYRYFPCPDLLPVIIDDDYIEAVRTTLPELPDAKRTRFQNDHGLSVMDAGVLASNRDLADWFETVANLCGDYKLAANWVMGDVSATLNRLEISIAELAVSAEQLGRILQLIKDNTLNNGGAREVFNALVEGKGDGSVACINTLVDSLGLKQVSDTGAIEAIVADVLAANQKLVETYLATPEDKRAKAMGPFIGLTRKAAKGVNPQVVMEVLQKKLNELG